MHETTLVGWDGSATAANAIDWAVGRALSQPVGARRLQIVRAVDDAAFAADDPGGRRAVDAATAEIAALAAGLTADHPELDVRTEVVRGEVGDVLTDRTGPDALVVVGGETRHTEEYWYSTRLGARLAGAAHGPVAVVPPGDDLPRSGVMVAVDDSPAALHVCRFAAQLATARGDALHAVHVGTRSHTIGTDQELLDDQIAPVVAEFPELKVESHLESGSTAGALLRRARERAVVVVGSRQQDAVVTNARCPTVVVPPQDAEGR